VMNAASVSVWLRNHAFLSSLIIFLCSVSPRLFLAGRENPGDLIVLYPDARTYLEPASSLITRGAFLNKTGNPEIHRTPGYPAFLAGIMMLTGSDLRRVLLVQTVLLSSGPLILYALARMIFPPLTAFVAGLISAFSPWAAILATVPLSDGLYLTLLTVLFLLMKICKDLDATHALVVAASIGLLTGVAVLVRPLWPLGVLIPSAFLYYAGLRQKRAFFLAAVILVCALAPLSIWRERNEKEARFNGLTDLAGETAWQYLASRVRAEASGQDRFHVVAQAEQEERAWGLPRWSEEIDKERWRQANVIFAAHPFLTAYSVARSTIEHVIHPSPDVLTPARLNFRGDVIALAILWAGLLSTAAYGLGVLVSGAERMRFEADYRLLMVMLAICLVLTLISGISFGQGARLRAPMEAIVPLLAAVSLAKD